MEPKNQVNRATRAVVMAISMRRTFMRERNRQQRSACSLGSAECQEGIPLGVSYTGTADVTNNGIPCRVWEPYELQDHQGVGHNHCRNPDEDPEGVWCNTDDQDETWGYLGLLEHCSNLCQVEGV